MDSHRWVFAALAVLAAQALLPASGYSVAEELQLDGQSVDALQSCGGKSVRSLIQTLAVQSQPPEEGGGEGKGGGDEEEGGKKGKKGGKKGGKSGKKEKDEVQEDGGENVTAGEEETAKAAGNKTADAGNKADAENKSDKEGEEVDKKGNKTDKEENATSKPGKGEEGSQKEEMGKESSKDNSPKDNSDDSGSERYVHIVPVVVPYPADAYQPDGKGGVTEAGVTPAVKETQEAESTEAEIRDKMKDATVAEEKELKKELENMEKSSAARQIVFSAAIMAALTHMIDF